MTATDAEFTRPQGTGMGTLGPGLSSPYSICSVPGLSLLALGRAQLGNIALRLYPWGDGLGGPEDDPDGAPSHASNPAPKAKRQLKARAPTKRKTPSPRKRQEPVQESSAEDDSDSDSDASSTPPRPARTATASPKAKTKRKPLYGSASPSKEEDDDCASLLSRCR